jgi:hypothetical protein
MGLGLGTLESESKKNFAGQTFDERGKMERSGNISGYRRY